MLNTMTDAELVDETKDGNPSAFRVLYYRHVDRIFGLVTRILGPGRPDREDVVQEVFFQAHKSLHRFRGDSSFSTWLHRIGINVTYSYIRRIAGKREILDDTERPPQDFKTDTNERRMDARRTVQKMFDRLNQMSAKNRLVFVLYEFEGLTLDRISESLDIPLNTAASRLRRSREVLMRACAEKTTFREQGGKA